MSSSKPNSTASDAVGSRRTRLERAITNPGAVKINVKGAFIVDEEPRSKSPASSTDGVRYESQDIRLPHHTGLVSHVAVDVSMDSYFRDSPQNYPPAISEFPAVTPQAA